MKSIAEELKAFLEVMENPVAVDNQDGTSEIKSDSSSCDVDNIPNATLENYLDMSRYGENSQHEVIRHKRKFDVRNGILYVN